MTDYAYEIQELWQKLKNCLSNTYPGRCNKEIWERNRSNCGGNWKNLMNVLATSHPSIPSYNHLSCGCNVGEWNTIRSVAGPLVNINDPLQALKAICTCFNGIYPGECNKGEWSNIRSQSAQILNSINTLEQIIQIDKIEEMKLLESHKKKEEMKLFQQYQGANSFLDYEYLKDIHEMWQKLKNCLSNTYPGRCNKDVWERIRSNCGGTWKNLMNVLATSHPRIPSSNHLSCGCNVGEWNTIRSVAGPLVNSNDALQALKTICACFNGIYPGECNKGEWNNIRSQSVQILNSINTLQVKMTNEENQKMKAEMKVLEQKIEEKKQATSLENYDNHSNLLFKDFVKKIENIPSAKTKKYSFALIGPSGVGKSSIINRILGKEVTEVGCIDCTKEFKKVFETNVLEVYDTPGASSAKDYENLGDVLKIKQMHVIVIAYSDRIEQVLNLITMIKSCGTSFVVVRNKCESYSQQQLSRIKNVEEKLIKTHCGVDQADIFLISAQTGMGTTELANVLGLY